MKSVLLPKIKGEKESELTKRYNTKKKDIEALRSSEYSSYLLSQLEVEYKELSNSKIKNIFNKISKLSWLFIISLIILLIVGFYPIIAEYLFNIEKGTNDAGTFGDSYGVLNALFSGLAFAGVIITLLMQNEDLKLTREELKKSVEAQNKSQEALYKQLDKMDISSRIDILNKYYEKLKADSSPSKEEIFKTETVLEHYAKEILNYDQYFDILKPKLLFQSAGKGSPNNITITFINIGSNANLLHFAYEPELEFINPETRDTLNHLSKIKLEFKYVEKFEMWYVLEDSHKNLWYQKFFLEDVDDKITLDDEVSHMIKN